MKLILLFILVLIPLSIFSQNDKLKKSIIDDLQNHQNNIEYLDSVCHYIYENYSMSNHILIKELSPYIQTISMKNSSKKIIAWSHLYKGLYLNIEGSNIDAVYNLEEALAFAREINDVLLQAYIDNQLALTYYQQDNSKIAIDYLLKSIDIFEKRYQTDKIYYASLNFLGLIHLDYVPEKALEYTRKAMEIADNNGIQFNRTMAYLQIAKAYIKMKNYSNALTSLKLSAEHNKIKYSKFTNDLINLSYAQVYKETGDIDKALSIYEQLIKNEILASKDYLFLIYVNLGDINYRKHKYEDAVKYYKLALANKSNSSKKFKLENLYNGLTEGYAKLNKADSALKYFKMYVESSSSINNNKNYEQSQGQLFSYELNKKELAIQKAIIEANNKEEKNKNYIIIGAVVIIVILLFYSIIYYRSYKKNYELSIRLKGEIEVNTKMLEELILAKVKIEESDNFKSSIIRNMTHEIRTPFNGLLGFINLIRKRVAEIEDDELSEYSELVEISSRRVYELISNLNDLALLESNDYNLNFSIIYLPDIINDVYFQYVDIAVSKGIALQLSNIDDLIFETDGAALSKALKNVVDNAIKFTSKGSVKIETVFTDDNLSICIIDTGIGIGKDNLANIGTPFKQVDMSISRSYEGMGIGLAITKEIINRLNGEMIVESKENEGTTVVFKLNKIKINTDILQD